MIEGLCAPAFSAVREEFETNFSSRGEVGAAVCVSVRGRVVVDLWGGLSEVGSGRRWERDTLVNIFSVGKAMAALCVARLWSRGLIDVDAPVSRYWPEFAAGGKSLVSVAELLSHQAGLPAVRRRLADDAMFDPSTMCSELAAQEPWWEPGTAVGYHTNTFGFLVGELVRRIDGRTLGTALREDVAQQIGADVYIGLPDSEHDRVAEFMWPRMDPSLSHGFGLDLGDGEGSMEYNTYFNPPGLSGFGVVNTPEWRRAEIPSTNGHATARGVARVYEAILSGEVLDPTARAVFTREHSSGTDLILHRPSRFGLGFQLTQPARPLGPNPGAFGHFGAGGSLGFCDPDAGVAFAYVLNTMGPRWQNPRNRALVDAVYASLN